MNHINNEKRDSLNGHSPYELSLLLLDKKLHKSSEQTVSPYQMILHNQKYYLMARSERWGDITFHRLDRITNIKILDQK